MAATQPTGEQIRFRSANTGDHVLDTYLESAEIGGRNLTDLLDDLFDPSNNGAFRTSNFEFQFNASTDKIQFRVGQYASSTAGWTDLTTFFSIKGTFSTSTTYNNFDVVTLSNKDVYIVHGLSSGATFSSESNFTSSANTEKLVDVQGAQDWASKVNGIVASTDYSAKAYAIGGTGVDTTSGSAKDWATKTSGTVGNTSDYSAKYYATQGNVASVAAGISNINAVAAKLTEISLLGQSAVITNMGLLGTSTVVGHMANLNGTNVLTNIANLNATGVLSDINTLAPKATEIGLLGTSAAITDMDTLATTANVAAMALLGTSAVVTDMGLLGTSANVTNMATLSASGVPANIATVATNIANVNNFANTYFISSSAPTGSNVGSGDLWYDNGTNTLKTYNGSSWSAISTSNTDSLSEGSSNLYYTNARVETYVSAGSSTPVFASGTSSGAWHVDSLTGPATLVIDPTAIGDNTGLVQIKGNLQVDGTQTSINSTTMNVADLNITLANGAANAGAANGAGLTIGGANATLTYVSATDTFAFNKNITAAGASMTTSDEATALAIALG